MLKKLLEKRSAVLARCGELQAFAAERELTAEERTEFDTKLAEIRSLGDQIKTAEELERVGADQQEREQRGTGTEPNRFQQQQERGTREMQGRTEVHDNAEDKPFATFGEHLRSVMDVATSRGLHYDPRLRKLDLSDVKVRAAAGMNEGVGSEGGFLVGTDQGALIEKEAFDTAVLAPDTTKIALSAGSNGIEMPYIDETSRATGSRFGGVRAYWVNEAATITASKPAVGKFKLGLNKLAALVYLTDEALQDATAAASIVSQAVSEELAFALDDALVRGIGAGSPLGMLNAPCLVTVSKEGSQAADTIVYENVSKMRTRMTPRMYAGAKWYINSECMPQIEQLNIKIKNVAGTENVGGLPVFVNGNASQTPYGTLFGRPIVPIEQCSAIGDVGDIILANLKYVYMSTKGGVQTASSIHVNFLTDEQVFRFIQRTDARSPFKSAITPYKGAATLSPFVTLEAR